jgi:N-acetylneuraminate synthase
MKIADREIGKNFEPLIVAEIGINHGGSLSLAKEMVVAIAKAGGEIVKHQTHFVDDEMTDEAKFIVPPNSNLSIWEIMESCALRPEEELELKTFAEGLGLIYISTPFSRQAASFLNEINVPAFKIGSGESDNLPLIRHIASFGKPVIMSTGMQEISSLRASVEILESANVPFALLECTNLYPSPPEIVSLSGVTELRNAFPKAIVGYSDHSIGPEMALASVALGACIVERHFTDTKYREGPDISCSMDALELATLIKKSKDIFIASQNVKKRTAAEEPVYEFARASIVADKDLPAGHKIGENDIWARRPGTGEIAGYEFDLVIGRTLVTKVSRNKQLKWSDFK